MILIHMTWWLDSMVLEVFPNPLDSGIPPRIAFPPPKAVEFHSLGNKFFTHLNQEIPDLSLPGHRVAGWWHLPPPHGGHTCLIQKPLPQILPGQASAAASQGAGEQQLRSSCRGAWRGSPARGTC